MKRITLLALALAFMAGTALAQSNEATVSQTGDQQTANVTQTGSNAATITQVAVANATQPGQQTSTVIQDGTNTATVLMSQTGGGGKTHSTAALQQVGTGNQMTQDMQMGDYSSGQRVDAYQEGVGNVGFQYITNGHTVFLQMDQIGDGNTSTQTGSGASHGDGRVRQEGDSNTADQTLNGSNNGYQGDMISIDQFGDGNQATQDFTGSGSSHHNNGIVDQDGDLNIASQIASGRDVNVRFYQQGDSNEAYITASGNDTDVLIEQFGVGSNYASLDLTGGATADVLQNGESNLLQGLSGALTAQVLSGGSLTVDQIGDLNNAFVGMTGVAGAGVITQTGSSNTATIDQQ